MKRAVKFFYLILFLLMACSGAENKQLKTETIISIDVTKAKEYNIYDVCDSIYMVPLNPAPIYAGNFAAERVLVADDYIFIVTDNYKQIDIFDKQGNKIDSINRIGRAPGEYIKVNAISYDKNKSELYVSSGVESKVVVYSIPNTQFLREEKYEQLVRASWNVGSKKALVTYKGDGTPDVLRMYGEDGAFEELPAISISCDVIDEGFGAVYGDNVLSYVDQGIYPTIYSVANDTIARVCVVEFGDRAFDRDKYYNSTEADYVYQFKTLFETDAHAGLPVFPLVSYEYISFMYNKDKIGINYLQYAVYNRKSGESKTISDLKISGVEQRLLPFTVYNDFYVALVVPENYIISDKSVLDPIGKMIYDEQLRVEKTTDVCTPFLLFYRLK